MDAALLTRPNLPKKHIIYIYKQREIGRRETENGAREEGGGNK